jgi:N-acetyl-gamma-glutamyl-phosphate reductase
MRVQIPLHAALLGPGATGKAVWELLADRYRSDPFVRVCALSEPSPTDERWLDPTSANGSNRVELHVLPNPAGHLLLVGILDNLGKGAGGAAMQNLNLMLGLPETLGLAL